MRLVLGIECKPESRLYSLRKPTLWSSKLPEGPARFVVRAFRLAGGTA